MSDLLRGEGDARQRQKRTENGTELAERGSVAELCVEARETARVCAGPVGNNPPIVRVLRGLADVCERMGSVLSEIAVDVVLADGLTEAEQVAALWSVVRRHTVIAKEAVRG